MTIMMMIMIGGRESGTEWMWRIREKERDGNDLPLH
jgi:hypothetical protein